MSLTNFSRAGTTPSPFGGLMFGVLTALVSAVAAMLPCGSRSSRLPAERI